MKKNTSKVAAASAASSLSLESASLDQQHLAIKKKFHMVQTHEIPRFQSAIRNLNLQLKRKSESGLSTTTWRFETKLLR